MSISTLVPNVGAALVPKKSTGEDKANGVKLARVRVNLPGKGLT